MAKSINSTSQDALLNTIKNNCNKMVACSAQPTTYAEANATYALADAAMAAADYTLAAGDTNGRKLTTTAKNGQTIDANGTATHIAHIDTVNSVLYYVTTCTSQALNIGGTVDFPAHKLEVSDPA